MSTPRNTRNAVNRQSATNSNTTSNAPVRKDEAKKLEIVLDSINPETKMFTRANGTEMERQVGSGYCDAIKCDVIVTRNLFDKDGNEKTMLDDSHIGKTLQALVNKVTDKDGNVTFFAEVSLSRTASSESINLFDSL
jgi:hypothetical protein